MKHRGVKIFVEKEEIPGSSLRELKNGNIVTCKPKFDKYYRFDNSYKYDSKKECKAVIDKIFKLSPNDMSDKEKANIINGITNKEI